MVRGFDGNIKFQSVISWYMHDVINFIACVPDSPCLNGGTCKEDGKGGYVCECPNGYSGRLCEIAGG